MGVRHVNVEFEGSEKKKSMKDMCKTNPMYSQHSAIYQTKPTLDIVNIRLYVKF